MQIKDMDIDGVRMLMIVDQWTFISDEQLAVDFIGKVLGEVGCDRVLLKKDAVPEDFFDFSTGLVGSILQKSVNYRVKIAFIGDFSAYESKSLRDFIYESNKGSNVFFLSAQQEAINKLSLV